MLKDALLTRERKREIQLSEKKLENMMWTSSSGPRGIRTCLINIYRITESKMLDLAEDSNTKQQLCLQLVDLADLILNGYKVQLDSLEPSERLESVLQQYEKCRTELIMPLGNK